MSEVDVQVPLRRPEWTAVPTHTPLEWNGDTESEQIAGVCKLLPNLLSSVSGEARVSA